MNASRNDPLRNLGDRFRVESHLGRGGMGDVYKAYDTVLERTVAVKTVTPGMAGAQAIERLLREARACARLTHRGIVTVHDVFQLEGSVHIVMEHLPGTSLASLHRFPRLSTLEAKPDIIVRILDALHYAHGRGVVHRDIKPTNVQLLPDGSVKLLDFGIAHLTGVAALTATGSVTGTAHYASPEQLRGEESNASTDVYSTGILTYELLTRRRPFDGDSIATVLSKVLNDPLPPMETSLSEHFPDLERIVRRATAKRHQDRYASAEDLKNALTAFLATSRDAIVSKQAEVAARAERLIVEAKSLMATGRTAAAIPLLTSVLRENPDAEEARELLRSSPDASAAAPDLAAASPASSESTVRIPAVVASGTDSTDAEPTVLLGPADSATPELPSPRSARRLLAVGASILILLTGVVVLGPRWMSPMSPDDAFPDPRPATADAETPEAPPAGTLASAPAEPPSPERAGQGSERDPFEATGSTPAAVPSPPAPATSPVVRPASSVEPPAATVANSGAKDLYYATTGPGLGASAADAPAAVGGAFNTGLKYTILRRAPNGDAVEVAADTMFRSGDRIRFGFEPNVDGYLYVIQRGSTGRWSVLLPHPLINGGRNDVTRFGEVTIPPEGWFRFDENPGSERVFVYLSREPIDTLPWGGGPVVNAQSVDQPTVIELANSVRSRDLTFEREDTSQGSDQAAYVVNQDAVGDAVAWTVELHHR